jgi:hypothetical protein
MTYRSRKLLDAAREAPICFSCDRPNDGTVVAAHSNQSRDGKGAGHKAADYRIAFLCCSCHSELDQGKCMSRQERIDTWEHAHRKTIGWLFESGKVIAA